jgi:hypothetical protein
VATCPDTAVVPPPIRVAKTKGKDDDLEQVNLDAMLARFTEHWSPKKIAQVNDYDVRIVKVRANSPGTSTPAPTSSS